MARNIVVRTSLGDITYPFPEAGDQVWGDTVTDWAEAITGATLQRGGGAFTLTGNANFGTSYGLLAKHFSSSAVNAATTGTLRLTNAEIISWRNNANTTDLSLTVNASDQLTYEGNPILFATGALTASRALQTNGFGSIATSAVTATELGYVAGVTSAIQTQLNTHTTTITANAATAAAAVTAHAALTTGVHGVTGNVVGTTDTQTLTNKTLTTPFINGERLKVRTLTTNTVPDLTDDILLCDATSGSVTVTMPLAATAINKVYHLKRIDASANTVNFVANGYGGGGDQLIGGTSLHKLGSRYDAAIIYCDGTTWHYLGQPPPIVARCSTTTVQQISAGAGAVIINFDTKTYDGHGAVTTGAAWKFTAPVPGKYKLTANILIDNTTTTYIGYMRIFKNGSSYSLSLPTYKNSATSYGLTFFISDTVMLAAGDYIDVRAEHNAGVYIQTSGTAGYNYVNIEKVSN